MKKTFLYTLSAVFILGMPAQTLADHHEIEQHKSSGHYEDKGSLFDKLDSDGDGTISREEFAKKRMKHKKDKKDIEDKMIKKIDENGDGILSEDEFMTKSKKRFSELDANGDGQVTKEEAKAHHEAKRKEWKEKRKEKAKEKAE